MHMCMHMCACTCTCMCACTCTCAHAHAHAHAHEHMHVHVHMRMHVRMRMHLHITPLGNVHRPHPCRRRRRVQQAPRRLTRLLQMQLPRRRIQRGGRAIPTQSSGPSFASTTIRPPSRSIQIIKMRRYRRVGTMMGHAVTGHAAGATTNSTGFTGRFGTGQGARHFVWFSCWPSSPSTLRSSRRWASDSALRSRLSRYVAGWLWLLCGWL